MVVYRRNNEDLKRAVREHSIEGYPLKVPHFGSALGVRTTGMREQQVVIAAPLEPMTYDKFAQSFHWDDEPKSREEWIEYSRSHNRPNPDSLSWIAPASQVRLEEGYKVSQKDINLDWLRMSKQVDPDGHMLSYSFDMSQVQMHPDDIQPGMIVEFYDAQERKAGTPGRVIAVGKDPEDNSKIVYLETFEPIPTLMGPQAVQPLLIDQSFIPDKTWVLGFGTYEAMRRKKVKLPTGMFAKDDQDKRVYFLDQPIPLSFIEEFCEKHYPKEPKCVLQSVTLMVLPIHAARDPHGRHGGGIFKPFPDHVRKDDIQIQIDEYGEGIGLDE